METLKKIAPEETRMGMFIHGFEGSWWQHPFWRTRFLLEAPEDLLKLRESAVRAVIIDISKGVGPDGTSTASTALRPDAAASAHGSLSAVQRLRQNMAARAPMTAAQDIERAEATRLAGHAMKLMKGVFQDMRLGKAIRHEEVGALVDDISRQVDRNAHMLMRVLQLKTKHQYTYLHSVAVCTLMVNLARHIGLPPAQVRELGLAGLLHDVGKMAIPEPVLDKPGRLSEEEFALMREHPERGAALLEAGDAIPPLAIEVCLHHHERIDGKGYPHGQSGEAITLASRMGAICDVYDAVTSNRAYKDAWQPVRAITEMWNWDGHFDRELLFRFMQSIGIFPVGTLVRLRSNRLAIVLPNGRRASRPRVLAFYCAIENAPIPHQTVTITDNLSDDQIVSVEDPHHWNVTLPQLD